MKIPSYPRLPGGLQIEMEVPPETPDFTRLVHHVDHLVGIPALLFLAPLIALDHLGVLEVSLPFEVVGDPLVQVIPPVDERVRHLCFGLAMPKREREVRLDKSIITRIFFFWDS